MKLDHRGILSSYVLTAFQFLLLFHHVHVHLFSDASELVFGGYVASLNDSSVSDMLTPDEIDRSSTLS